MRKIILYQLMMIGFALLSTNMLQARVIDITYPTSGQNNGGIVFNLDRSKGPFEITWRLFNEPSAVMQNAEGDENLVSYKISGLSANKYVIRVIGRIACAYEIVVDLSEEGDDPDISEIDPAGKQLSEEPLDDFSWVQVTPNPFKEQVKVSYNSPETMSVHCEVFDMSGRKIYDQQFEAQVGKNDFWLNQRIFKTSGVYFLRLSARGEMQVTTTLMYTN